MKERLLIKHAVGGRTFIDTGVTLLPYEVVQSGDGWKFTVKAPVDSKIQDILDWKEELNVFIFQEYQDRPTKKIWFYVKDGPVTFDRENQTLEIFAASRIEYVPDEF